MDKNIIIEQLSQLIMDSDFAALSLRAKSTSFLETISFDENKKSDLLAWLLNPSEGHLQTDYFIRALINAAVLADANNNVDIEFRHWLISRSFQKMVPMREFVIAESNRRIDLLLIDRANKLLVLIERKDGSRLNKGQAAHYANWAETCFGDWKKLFILSDSQSKNHGTEFDSRYILLDDQWLCDAIQLLLDRNSLPEKIEIQLRDLHDFVFGEWEEQNDPFYKGLTEQIKKVASRYSGLLRKLETVDIYVKGIKYPLYHIDPKCFYSHILPHATESDMLMADLIQQNHTVFSWLHGNSEFNELEDKIQSLHSELTFEFGKETISFSLKKHDVGEYWAYYFNIERQFVDEQECYRAYVTVCRYSILELHPIADRIAEYYGIPFPKHRKENSVVILEYIPTIDFQPNSELYTKVDEFIRFTSKIPLPKIDS